MTSTLQAAINPYLAEHNENPKPVVNTASADDIAMPPGTFIYNPVKHFDYFHEAPELFAELGYLHHPVKMREQATVSDLAEVQGK